MEISGEAHASFMSTKGAYVPQSWDIYWTVRRACHSVLGAIAPPKRVNCVPGVEAVAYKQPLVRTMQEAYGEAAFDYIPRSYMLPSQYWVWRAWSQRSGCPPELPWVLKANDHRGRGVRVMRQWQAQRQALRGADAPTQGDTATQKGFVLIQSYVRQQFLYDNRPSYLRLWVVVTSVRPLRVYLFRGGVLVFGDRLTGAAAAADGGERAGAAAKRHRSGGGHRRQVLRASGVAELPVVDPWLAADGQPPWTRQRVSAAEPWAREGPSVGGGSRHAFRRRLQQQQVAGSTTAQQQQTKQQKQRMRRETYEMHSVNYWTISGEKVQPWTVGQLRRHAEAVWPDDPRVIDHTWAHARASVGMVLASAARRMRSAARGLAALDGCGFEVLGVDFLLNATLYPTLVEINALPSLARLRVAPGDPAHGTGDAAGTAATEGAEGAAAAAAATAPFDLEKARFLNHMLRLVGMPIGPPPVRGDASYSNATAAAAADAAASPMLPSPSVGGVLRAMAALLRPPNNETSELQEYLRMHLPYDVAAAAAALSALRPLLCPVPAVWGPAPGWPVLEAAATKVTATTIETAGAGRRLATAAAEGSVGPAAADMAAAPRPKGRLDLTRDVALGEAPPQRGMRRARLPTMFTAARGGEAVTLTRRALAQRAGAHAIAGAVTATAAAAASAAAAALASAVGLDRDGDVPPHLEHEGTVNPDSTDGTRSQARRSLQGAGGGRDLREGISGGGGAVAAPPPPPCRRRCYDWDVLAAIADTEYELQQNLDFDPIFPMAAAHDLNGAALEAARNLAADAVQRPRTNAGGGGSGGDTGAVGFGPDSGELGFNGGGGAFPGSDLLDPGPQTGFQRLKTGLGFVRDSITAVNMDLMRSMRYMTTTPYVTASTKLPYSRIDAALSAFEAARRRPGSCASQWAAASTGETAAAAAAADVAACAVRVLQDTLDELCSGRMKPEQA